jgi:alpha-galactosidase
MKKNGLILLPLVFVFLFCVGLLPQAETFGIETLDLRNIEQGWGSPHANQSVDGHALSIGGIKFERGLGTHANSTFRISLEGAGDRFTAAVGVDDEIGNRGSIEFKVLGDGKTLWESGVMRGGDKPKEASADLRGIKMLTLLVTDAGDGFNYDHADWAEAKIAMLSGKPAALAPVREPAVILTPVSPASPRINGPKVFGVRPDSPFLFTIPASGQRPMTFGARNLPRGLAIDPKSGQIRGVLSEKKTYIVTLTAQNKLGKAERPFKIVCGDAIALTPPLGWNSWNCFACDVSDAKVRAAADAMVQSGLIQHGWSYINIDDCWQGGRDADGAIIPNQKFPDMKALAAYVHGLGLKIGLYSSPGPKTCAGHEGSYKHEQQDARCYAEWGFDYLKHDWCSYSGIAPRNPGYEDLVKPYRIMREALNAVPRDIVYSLCQYGMGNVWEWGAQVGGNCWRTTGDITDSWSSMSGIGFGQAGHEKYAGPGHWNDPDMLVVGYVGWSANVRMTKLTPNEQYTHISLWCLLSSPLLIGCDMTRMDDFTFNLLSNDEVLEVSQDRLGRQAARVAKDGTAEVWAKDMEDGSKAVGLFNRGEDEAPVTATWAALGIQGKQKVRDLWRQKDFDVCDGKFQASVPRHGVVLIRISAAK